MYNILANADYDNIKVLPFRDVTLPLHNMHPSSDDFEDCTHYCYFPQMWQGLWYDIDYYATNHTTSLNAYHNGEKSILGQSTVESTS